MKRVFIYLHFFVLLICSCRKEKPQVLFSYSGSAYVDSIISFSNKSTGAKKYDWDFGDGSKSNEKSPIHFYKKEGTYTVVLNAKKYNSTTQFSSIISILDKQKEMDELLKLKIAEGTFKFSGWSSYEYRWGYNSANSSKTYKDTLIQVSVKDSILTILNNQIIFDKESSELSKLIFVYKYPSLGGWHDINTKFVLNLSDMTVEYNDVRYYRDSHELTKMSLTGIKQ